MKGFWRGRGRSEDTGTGLRGSDAATEGPGGQTAEEVAAPAGLTPRARLNRFFQVNSTAGRVGRLLAIGATGATLIAATPNHLPDEDSDTGPADDQYAEQVTVCGRLGADSSDRQTLRLPIPEAEALLRGDSSATQGPC